MTKLGTITYANVDWEVIAFHGEVDGSAVTVGPTPPERPEYIIDDLIEEDGMAAGYEIVRRLENEGFAIVYTKEAT